MVDLFFIGVVLVVAIRALFIVVIGGRILERVGQGGGGRGIELELGIGLVDHLVVPGDIMMTGFVACVFHERYDDGMCELWCWDQNTSNKVQNDKCDDDQEGYAP